jgi:hypothetical protein
MPEILRSATMSIEQGIDLPMGPPIIIIGRGTDGKAVCQVHINATGIVIRGPKGAEIRTVNWDQLLELAQG